MIVTTTDTKEFYGLYGQHYDRNGEAVAGEFQVTNKNPRSLSVAMSAGSANGSFVVVWEESVYRDHDHALYGQCYNETGDPVSEEFQIATETSYLFYPVAMDDAGNFVVVWVGGDDDGDTVFL